MRRGGAGGTGSMSVTVPVRRGGVRGADRGDATDVIRGRYEGGEHIPVREMAWSYSVVIKQD